MALTLKSKSGSMGSKMPSTPGTTAYADFQSYIQASMTAAHVFKLTNDRLIVHKHMKHYAKCAHKVIYQIGKQITVEFGPLKGWADYGAEMFEDMDPLEYFKMFKKYLENKLDTLFKDAPDNVKGMIKKLVKLVANTIFHLQLLTQP